MNQTTIGALHDLLAKVVREAVGVRVVVTTVGYGRTLERLKPEDRIRFELSAALGVAPLRTAQRHLGGVAPVIPLWDTASDLDELPWASWGEEWQCTQAGEYMPMSFGWTFYWGIAGGSKRQLLRAEWDASIGGNAQPHWQVDEEFIEEAIFTPGYSSVASVATEGVSETSQTLLEQAPIRLPGGLEELTQTIFAIDIGGMHLGMGGWQNAEDHPQCWRRSLPILWNEVQDGIVLWMRRTLDLARDQFRQVAVQRV